MSRALVPQLPSTFSWYRHSVLHHVRDNCLIVNRDLDTYLGIKAVVFVTSGAGLTDSTGFISMLSVWLIHRSGFFSSFCFFLADPLD